MSTQIIIEGTNYHQPHSRSGMKWTPQEVEYLTLHFPFEDPKQISNYLKRSIAAIVIKASSLNLKKIKRTEVVEYPIRPKTNTPAMKSRIIGNYKE